MSRSVEEIKNAIRSHDALGNDDEVAELQIMLAEAKAAGGQALVQQGPEAVGMGEELQGGIDTLLKGATMSLGDEAQGAVGATSAMFQNFIKELTGFGSGLAPSQVVMPGKEGADMSFGEAYEGTRDIARESQEGFAERNPNAAMALEVGGTLATGGLGGTKLLASQAVKQAPKVVKALAVPALFAAEGGAYGFGEGEGLEDSLIKAGTGAATSAVVGPVVNKALKFGIEKMATPFAKKVREAGQKSTSLDDLKKGYKKAYKIVDDSGVQISAEAYKPFKDFLKKEIKREYGKAKYIKGMENPTQELLRLKNPTVKELSNVRNMIDVAIKGNKASRTAGMKLDKKITDYISYLGPGDVTKGANKVIGVGDQLKKGDALFSRHAQGTTIKKMIDRRATSGVDKNLSAEARKLLNNEKKQLGLDDKVVDKLSDLEEGTGLKQIIRFGASLNPSMASARNPIASAMTGGAGFLLSGGNPIGAMIALAVPTVTGVAFTQIANKMTKVEMDNIMHIAMNKGQEELADIIERMVGKYTKGVTAATLAATPQATDLQDMITGSRP